jgi:hypothetical protein
MSKQAHDRSRAGAQRARAAIASIVLALCGIVPPFAHAGPNDGPPRRDDQQQQQQQQGRRDSRWGSATDARSFEARAEEQRRMMQENANNAEISRRMSRMTPDERRDLRRQINEAGMEVYSVTPKR